MKLKYKVSQVVRENAPSFYAVFDITDKSQGFNGRLVSEHETEEAAQADCDALNAGSVTCVFCVGSGERKGEDCAHCGGTGEAS